MKESFLKLGKEELEDLLNDRAKCFKVSGANNYVGVKHGKIYAFKSDGNNNFHAYQITGNEVVHRFSSVKKEVATALLLSSAQKLEQMMQL
jgi:hypothetical protein